MVYPGISALALVLALELALAVAYPGTLSLADWLALELELAAG